MQARNSGDYVGLREKKGMGGPSSTEKTRVAAGTAHISVISLGGTGKEIEKGAHPQGGPFFKKKFLASSIRKGGTGGGPVIGWFGAPNHGGICVRMNHPTFIQ